MKTMKWLLRREFWEHKGAFFWAPVTVAAAMLLLMGGGFMYALAAGGHDTIQFNGHSVVSIQGVPPALRAKLAYAAASGYLGLAAPLFIVLAVVVFFYCLAALHDDRRDRSILFWKSLPLSDRDTVLSKVASATVVAPVIAVLAALATMLGSMAIWSVVVMFHGGNPATLLWGPASPLAILGTLIACIPLFALWALPTVGWLMLCSAWSKSKPFLWAIMIPLFAGIFVSWFDLMQLVNLDSSWFWRHVVGRSLLSLVPGSWMGDVAEMSSGSLDPTGISQFLSLRSMYSIFGTAQMWIGVLAGAAMIFGAIRLRRWRDEG